MLWLDLLRWAHVLGACVLIGTGAGIAFFMLMAHRTRSPALIAHTAGIVVIADGLFTATAAIAQPITGIFLARGLGWPLSEGWLILSIALYVVIGVFWLPVVYIQIQLRSEARLAVAKGKELSPKYQRLFRLWFACGIPAFASIVVILWLMLMRPALTLW